MFNRILVPLDGSKLAERALPHARRFAQTFDSSITLLQVLDSSPYRETASATEPLNWQIRKAQADQYLSEQAAKLRQQGYRADHVLREGKTAENIIDYAQAENIDLVVLTTHGESGLSRWNMSSVVQKVISKVYLPLLLIRAYQLPAGSPENNGAEPVETDGEVDYMRILLPIDTSRRAECALPAAVALSNGPTQLLVAAVITPPNLPIPIPYPDEINHLIESFIQVSRDAVREYLEEQQRRMPEPVETRMIESPNIPAAIHELAEQENVDLVILCAHGQSGKINWPYGSVATNYLEHGERTVLVIQDVPLSQVRPTPAETAAEKYGRR